MTEPHTLDRSAALQQGTREFAGVYERHAYLVYNLALRTTVDARAAIEAASSAFLACMSSSDADAEIQSVAVRRSLALAKQTATLEAAGDAEAQKLLSLTERLPATERAVLALETLASADLAAVAAALETTEDAADTVIERAWGAFARACGLPLEAAKEAYRAWLWAEPPTELWELLYPSFYEHLVKRVNAKASEDAGSTSETAVLAAVAQRPSRSERRRARRAEKDARRGKPPGRVRRAIRAIPVGWTAAAVALLAAGTGGAYAAGVFGGQTSNQGPGASSYAQPQSQMSPAELARLRAEQRRAALNYAAQQRAYQRQLGRQGGLAKAAWLQQRAAQLVAAKRRQAAANRARQLAARQPGFQLPVAPAPQASAPPARPTAPAPSPPPSSSNQGGSGGGSGGGSPNRGSGTGSSHGGGSPNPTPGQVQQQCLYNANDGTWVCPQGK